MLTLRTIAAALILSALLLYNSYYQLAKWVVDHWTYSYTSWANPTLGEVLGTSTAIYSMVLFGVLGVAILVSSVVWPLFEQTLNAMVAWTRRKPESP